MSKREADAECSAAKKAKTPSAGTLDVKQVKDYVQAKWDSEILTELSNYIAIPAQSQAFDSNWAENGHIDKAMDLLVAWVKAQEVPDLTLKVLRSEGKSPLLCMEVPATNDSKDTVLLYGHMDKQPPMTEYWDKDLGPWKPVLKDGRLYGRGGADDGYSTFAAITAIHAIKKQGLAHDRLLVIIEAGEESGSPDLAYYLDQIDMGDVALVICLDSGAGNYEQLWLTTSLRGTIVGDLKVETLKEGLHSGNSGKVASSFRILRTLLDRVEDAETGKVKLSEAWTEIPEDSVNLMKTCAATLDQQIIKALPLAGGTQPVSQDVTELLLNAGWRPQISYTGAAGLPALADAGNVLRTHTSVRLSIRLPPTVPPQPAVEAFTKALTTNVPYGANATINWTKASQGWAAPPLLPWMKSACEKASNSFFDKPFGALCEGGSIPFMGMLGRRFPKAQFFVVGLLGPNSNAHGPNEFLSVPMFHGVTGCVASVLVDCGARTL